MVNNEAPRPMGHWEIRATIIKDGQEDETWDTMSWARRALITTFCFLRDDPVLDPIIKAAGAPESSSLRDLLQQANSLSQGDRMRYVMDFVHQDHRSGRWETPLLYAISTQRIENVRLLLQNGSSPSGIDLESQKVYARRFRRFITDRKRKIQSAAEMRIGEFSDFNTVPLQATPLTESEIIDRRFAVSHFWTDRNSTDLSLSLGGDTLHSLVRAGSTTPAIFDLVFEAGSECQFWRDAETSATLPEEDELSPSALCLSTPLHSAIAANDMLMLRTILDHGFNPNARALIAGPQAFTPLQFAVLTGNKDAYTMLAGHPLADPNILTPVYDVHILHIAVAKLRVDWLDFMQQRLDRAGDTALGHSLLHIACLPWAQNGIRRKSAKSAESIHDVRGFQAVWSSVGELGDPEAFEVDEEEVPKDTAPFQTAEQHLFLNGERHGPRNGNAAQEAMYMRLVADLGEESLGKTDVHGNTALHYLAGVKPLNEPLISRLRSLEGVEEVWQTQRNVWEWTPADLLLDQKLADADPRASWEWG